MGVRVRVCRSTVIMILSRLEDSSDGCFWRLHDYILFRDVEHSGTGSAPESVTTNSYRFLESITIPSDSALHQFPEFRPIPPCINSRNSVRFRLASIPGIPSDSGIPNRNHTSAFTLMHCDMLEGYSI